MSEQEKDLLPFDLKPANINKARLNLDANIETVGDFGDKSSATSNIFDQVDHERFMRALLRAQPPATISKYKLRVDRGLSPILFAK